MGKKVVIVLDGRLADGGLVDDDARLYGRIFAPGNSHHGHIVVIDSFKANCGAYGSAVCCECEAQYEWSSGGCWSHPSANRGDAELGAS